MNVVDIIETRLQKWDNSVGIRIPHSILKDLNLKINDLINIEKKDNSVMMLTNACIEE